MSDEQSARKAVAAAAHLREQSDRARSNVERLEEKLAAVDEVLAEKVAVKLATAREAAAAAEAAADEAEALVAELGPAGPFEPGPVVNAHAGTARGAGAAT